MGNKVLLNLLTEDLADLEHALTLATHTYKDFIRQEEMEKSGGNSQRKAAWQRDIDRYQRLREHIISVLAVEPSIPATDMVS